MEENISNVSNFINLKHSALDEVKKRFSDEYSIVKPTNYFKLRTLQEIGEQSQAIKIMVNTNITISNSGDGVSVNKKAARVLHNLYGLRLHTLPQILYCIC